MYQMYAYARRYECPDVVLVYPHHAGLGNSAGSRRSYSVQHGNQAADSGRVRIATIDLSDLRTVPAQLKAVVAPQT
jgi:5-methylcytosine-specific restriction enzyme subunit McrC